MNMVAICTHPLEAAPVIGFEHQELINQALLQYPPLSSEMLFSNVWTWRETYPRRVAEYKGHILLGYKDRNSWILLPPIGPQPEAVIAELSKIHGYCWHRIPEQIAERVTGVTVERDPDEDDFVLHRKTVEELSGHFYRHIRTHRNHCLKLNPDVRPFTLAEVPACLSIGARWLECKGDECTDVHRRDVASANQMLELASRVELNGLVIFIDGQPAAFHLGQRLNSNTYVAHFAKADLRYNGLSDFLLHSWVCRLPADCEYINLEQAQGEPGLIAFKRKWDPNIDRYFVRKYRIQ